MVDQFIVIGRHIAAEAVALGLQFRQRRGHAPAGGGRVGRALDLDRVGGLLLPHHAQEHTGAVEKAVGLVQVRGPHGHIPGIDFVMHQQRAGHGRGLPGMFVQLGQRHVLAVRFGANLDDVAGEFADHVAARYPGRQRQHLALLCRRAHGQRDLEQVARQVLGHDGVGDGGALLVMCFLHFLSYSWSVSGPAHGGARSSVVSISCSTPPSSTATSHTRCERRMARAPWSPSSASSSGR